MDLDSLIRQMEHGLSPSELLHGQVMILEKTYGKNWFDELGYDDTCCQRSIFDPKRGNKVYTSLEKLLGNMSNGLTPDDLTEDEKSLLKKNLGPNWRSQLGYEDDGKREVSGYERKKEEWIKKYHPPESYGSWAAAVKYSLDKT